MSRRLLAVLALVALVFTGAACSDDEAGDDTTTSSTADDAGATDPATDDPAGSGDATGGDSFCDLVVTQGEPTDGDTAGYIAYYEKVKAVAPEELQADIEIIIAKYEEIEAAGGNPRDADSDTDTGRSFTAVTRTALNSCGEG
jgi:hypothetical protein